MLSDIEIAQQAKLLPIKDVAAQLGISEDGVKVRLKHAYEKLDVSDRAGAIAVAIKRGISRPSGVV